MLLRVKKSASASDPSRKETVWNHFTP